jgi:hypothetical protein
MTSSSGLSQSAGIGADLEPARKHPPCAGSGPIRCSEQDHLSIKSLAMKVARPNILDWTKDKLDVNL